MSDFGYVKQKNSKNTGLFYKFIKSGDVFIHTMCEGKLLYDLGFIPEDIIGKTLHDFYPYEYANTKHQYYLEAWNGKFVQYESIIEGIYQVDALTPVFKNGEVVEVVGSSINVPEQLKKEVSQKDHSHQTVLKLMSDLIYHSLQLGTLMINETNERPFAPVRRDLMIKQNNNIIFISQKEIIFIERIDRKAVIHTINKQFETYQTLNNLSQHLDGSFLQCHRSYIINIDYLEVIEPSGQSYIGHFKKYTRTAKISKNKILEIQKYKSY